MQVGKTLRATETLLFLLNRENIHALRIRIGRNFNLPSQIDRCPAMADCMLEKLARMREDRDGW